MLITLLISLALASEPKTCYSLRDVLNEGCRASCVKTGRGEGGEVDKNRICWCKNGAPYDDFINNRVDVKNIKGKVILPPPEFID